MGKPKLRSPIKALHQALLNFKPPACKSTTWVCIQQAKTDSFRDPFNSFHSADHSASSSSISLDIYSTNEESIDSDDDSHLPQLALKDFISSKRFFFSPCTTKSIMEEESEPSVPASEEKTGMGAHEIFFSDSQWIETDDETENGAGEREESMIMERGFCKDSVKMAMASMDPFLDFRVSMEEMVIAHGLRDWSCLQDLLQCYLSLNHKQHHKTIILAFADLLNHLMTEETDDDRSDSSISSSSSSKEICLPFPLRLQSWKKEKN